MATEERKEAVEELGLVFSVRGFLYNQKARISSAARISQLAKQGKRDPGAEIIFRHAHAAEEELRSILEGSIKKHPVWQRWLKDVHGVGPLLAAEIIGEFEGAFRENEGIEHFRTVSQMWAFAGLSVKDGKAVRLKKGEKAPYNGRLKSILLGRLGASLIKRDPKKSGYRRLYEKFKQEESLKIKGTEGGLASKNIHKRALRKMVKVFVSHLFEEWRKAYGLEAGRAYVFEKLGHSDYLPPIRDR